MYVKKKEEYKRDNICKNHSAKSERDPLRVCPSKLSKRELEDLYYTVLEANVDLKKTINNQEDIIKTLSTKVKRMTVTPKVAPGRENDCYSNIKAMVNEQKQSLADLKKQNERLCERIRVLNMRLCSAKQFLKKSPGGSTTRCLKCSAPLTSVKNSSVSINNAQANDPKSAVVSSQYLDKDVGLSTRTVETETDERDEVNTNKLCDENKCRSMIEELKQKIVDLQEELSKSHKDYSTRISRLEEEVNSLRVDKERLAVERVQSRQQMQLRDDRADQLAARLRTAEAQYGELAMELSIEKRKVAELETRVKAVDMSSTVAKTIEDHLSNASQIQNEIEKEKNQLDTNTSPLLTPRDKSSARHLEPSETRGLPSDATDQADDNKVSKLSDDSGFVADSPGAEDKAAQKVLYDEIRDRILFLQDQIDMLKQSAKKPEVKESVKTMPSKVLSFTPSLQQPPRAASGDSREGDYHTRGSVQPESHVSQERVEPQENKLNAAAPRVKNTPSLVQDNNKQNAPGLDHYEYDTGFVKEAKGAFVKVKSVERNRLDSELKVIPAPGLGWPVFEKAAAFRSDSHNGIQIPGPLPVDQVGVGSPVKKKKRQKNMKRDSTDSTMSHAKEVISLDIDNYEDIAGTNKYKDNLGMDDYKDNLGTDDYKDNLSSYNNKDLNEERASHNSQQCDKVRKSTLLLDESSLLFTPDALRKEMKPGPSRPERDTGNQGDKKFQANNYANVKDGELVKVAGPSLTEKSVEDNMTYYVPNSQVMISDSKEMVTTEAKPEAPVRPTGDSKGQIELCAQYARLCSCGGARRRGGPLLRACSPCAAPAPHAPPAPPAPPAPLNYCSCSPAAHPAPAPSPQSDKDTQTFSEPASAQESPRRFATYSKDASPKTYSLPPRSPDNTDFEISTLTDLPSEKDGKSPRILSPGEKPVSTYTESYSAPTTTDYGALSEGELPGAGAGRRFSVGEAKVNFRDNSGITMQRMEEALTAISEELALCRDMLQGKHQQGKKSSKDASLMVDLLPEPIALKRAAASPRIGNAFTPKCIFTLHIGTVVLSDEAVINSREMSLVLTWKFYDQNMTMTRMKAGRVMLFDFSTEYDIKVTDQFLDYLKHDEMQLNICELDNQWEPFATCALRLRDALLHANRRADMSLALMAGPQLKRTRAALAALDSSDEVGVLDLWCMLRVDPALLPSINRAIARNSARPESVDRRASMSMSSTQSSRRSSRVAQSQRGLPQLPEDSSQEDQLSIDLQMNVQSRKQSKEYEDEQELDTPGQTKRFTPDTDVRSNHSKITINEVSTKNRSAYEMRQALGANQDATSQTQSTANSWKGLMMRRQFPKPAKQTGNACNVRNEEKDNKSFPSFFKYYSRENHAGRMSKCSKGFPAPIRPSEDEIAEPVELSKVSRVENTSKKSVTITDWDKGNTVYYDCEPSEDQLSQNIEITIMWLALNEECDAMTNPSVQRLYVAYSFLGRSGAALETPVSLPKPANYVDKCIFQFSKMFVLNECDLALVGHMAKCRSTRAHPDPRDCVMFTVISEPPEDPLGLDSCEDIGYAYLYFGDLLEYSAGSDTFTEVIPVLSAHEGEEVCGVLSIKVDGLDVVRRCALLAGPGQSPRGRR